MAEKTTARHSNPTTGQKRNWSINGVSSMVPDSIRIMITPTDRLKVNANTQKLTIDVKNRVLRRSSIAGRSLAHYR